MEDNEKENKYFEKFHYRLIKGIDDTDVLSIKPELQEMEKEAEEEELSIILKKEFSEKESCAIKVPSPFEEITPPEPLGLPPPPPVIR